MFNQIKMSSCKRTKHWPDWKNNKHFTVYSRDSGTGKFVSFTIADVLLDPVGFPAYRTSI